MAIASKTAISKMVAPLVNLARKRKGLPPLTTTQSPTEFGGLQPQKDKTGNVLRSQEKQEKQDYAQIPDYMNLAKEYLPDPEPLAALE